MDLHRRTHMKGECREEIEGSRLRVCTREENLGHLRGMAGRKVSIGC